MKPTTSEWVEKAEEDCQIGIAVWKSDNPVFSGICFHAQQCAEKYLKSWLVEQEVQFPKAHDLRELANLCRPSLPDLSPLMDDLRDLTASAVEIRYPGASADRTEAEKCWRIGLRVRDLVRGKFGLGTS